MDNRLHRRVFDHELEKTLERAEQKIEELISQNKILTEKVEDLVTENKRLKKEGKNMREYINKLPDEKETEELSKAVDSLEKQVMKMESGREMLLYQIKTLEESKADLKEQLYELRRKKE